MFNFCLKLIALQLYKKINKAVAKGHFKQQNSTCV